VREHTCGVWMHDGAVCGKLSAQLPPKVNTTVVTDQYEQHALLKCDTAVVLFQFDSASFCRSRYALFKAT